MKKLLRTRLLWLFTLYILGDIICIGMGMGVPIFCIVFGFIAGWFTARYITNTTSEVPEVMRKAFCAAIVTSAVTFVGMLALWVPFASFLFNPAKDLANTGIPMILYEPRASLIGWIVLMVLISPFLQLLTTLFGSYTTLLVWLNKAPYDKKAV